MDPYITFDLVLLAVLFLLSGFFAASEAALFSLTSLHLHKMREERFPFLSFVEKLLSYPRKLLITIIVSNEVVNIVLSTLMTGLLIRQIGDRGKWVAIAITMPLLLVFGEAVPKTLARTSPLQFSSLTAPVVSLVSTIAYPIIWALEKISGWIISPFRGGGAPPRDILMEGDLRTLVDIGYEEGVLDKSQRDLIHQVFDLDDTEVGEIMTPRVDMFCLPLTLDLRDVRQEIIRHGLSRIPVYDQDPDDIVGILYARDLLTGVSVNGTLPPIASLLKKPYFIPLEKSAGGLLRDFQSRKMHMAIIVDEYGGIAGLVTMEDILEGLFGDIYDERDKRERLYHVLSDGSLMVLGMMPIDDFNELAGTDIPSEDFDTIGGYVLHLFGRLPAKGDKIEDDRCVFRIEKMTKARIMRIRVSMKETNRKEAE